jgi:hypothetical protein
MQTYEFELINMASLMEKILEKVSEKPSLDPVIEPEPENPDECKKKLSELETWVRDAEAKHEENVTELDNLLSKVESLASEKKFKITQNKEFLEWAAWHTFEGAPPCNLTDEGIELCYKPEIPSEITEYFMASKFADGFPDLETMGGAFMDIVEFRGKHGIEPLMIAGMPWVDLGSCDEEKQEYGYGLLD